MEFGGSSREKRGKKEKKIIKIRVWRRKKREKEGNMIRVWRRKKRGKKEKKKMLSHYFHNTFIINLK